MSTVIYTGRYASTDGHQWRADILSDTVTAASDAELAFAPSAAELEWTETGRYEAVCGSACTLTLISPADRTFTSLYSRKVGDVHLNLYRDGQLWWSGELDPELYEEPYAALDHYEVVLTFTDLGILDQAAYDGNASGRASLSTLLHSALAKAGHPQSITSMFDLRRPDSTALGIDDISVDLTNFFDEDGEAMTWLEVIKSILTPLGLRITQRSGTFYVYDLPTLRAAAAAAIYWTSTNQSLGVDKVYNNISVNFSPYGDATVIDAAMSYSEAEITAWIQSHYYRNTNVDNPDAFNAFCIDVVTIKNFPYTCHGNRSWPYKLTAYYSGQDDVGVVSCLTNPTGADDRVLGTVYNADHVSSDAPAGPYVPWGDGASAAGAVPLTRAYDQILYNFETPTRYIRGGDTTRMLRIRLDLLLDVRCNPFESASVHNEEGDYNRATERWTRCYVPVRIYIVAADGTKWYLCNDVVRRGYSLDQATAARVTDADNLSSVWRTDQSHWGACWLSYYDFSDPNKKSGVTNGWATNRQTVGQRFAGEIPEWWSRRGDGLFVPMPPVSGTLHFEVGKGVAVSDTVGRVYDTYNWSMNPTGIFQARWLMYRNAEIVIVDQYGKEVECEDIVYRATVDTEAHSELSLDTTNGSVGGTMPTARALYYVDGAPVDTLRRGDLCDKPERLLIASVASQYDNRHARLSGEARADRGLHPYTDAAQPAGTVFIQSSCIQRTAEGVGDCTFIELSNPKYYPET